jgi:D-glycero-D-manno-heptose 1,7-bisphosphate phosphatase
MPYVLLDRDGVINHDSEKYIKSPAEWLPIDGSLEAIAKFNRAGFKVIVATNQSGIARGLYDEPTLHQIHDKFLRMVAEAGGKVEEIFFCPHHPDERCGCRKPQPGMLHQIEKKYGVVMSETFFIGDSIGDIRVAQTVGCRPGLVLTGNGKKSLLQFPELAEVQQFNDLAHAAEIICALQDGSGS